MKKIIFILVLMFTCNSLVFAHTSYNKGDVVKFANANWIVIENSSENSDYVTALKDKWLTNEELGDYATGDTDKMIFGLENSQYSQSLVKEFLENTYINKLGDDKLKEVNGCKIRLLYHNEVLSAMNNYRNNGYLWMSTDAEEWLYKDLDGNIVTDYWVAHNNTNLYVLSIAYSSNQVIYGNDSYNLSIQVRPVINLLKSSIVNEIDNNNENEQPKDNNGVVSNENNIVTSTDDNNKTREVVKVPNTLMRVSLLFVIFGFVIICIGSYGYIILSSKRK